MADVFLAEVGSTDQELSWIDSLSILRACAAADRFGVHRLCESPEAADVVLLTDARARGVAPVLAHPAYRRHVEKAFLYSFSDYVFPFVPGVYPSISRPDYDPRRVRSGPYLKVIRSDHINYVPPRPDARYLFSFVGSVCTSPVRRRLPDLRHPAAFVRDTTAAPGRGEGWPAEVYRSYKERYAEVLRDSRFILCPRGAGASSIRLFEALKAGRAPVILSDEWVEPVGPDWPTFSVRVPERDVGALPTLLEHLAWRAAEMGRLAREAWSAWFGENVVFHRLVETCLQLKAGRRFPERLSRLLVYPRLLLPRHLRPAVFRRSRDFLRNRLRGRRPAA